MTDGRFTAMGNVVAQNGRFFANKYNPADSLIYAISAAWANGNNHKLYTINPTTGTATFKTNLSGTIVNPFGLAFNSKGQAYIADAFTDRLYAFEIQAQVFAPLLAQLL